MKRRTTKLLLGLSIFVILISCNKETKIGSEYLSVSDVKAISENVETYFSKLFKSESEGANSDGSYAADEFIEQVFYNYGLFQEIGFNDFLKEMSVDGDGLKALSLVSLALSC